VLVAAVVLLATPLLLLAAGWIPGRTVALLMGIGLVSIPVARFTSPLLHSVARARRDLAAQRSQGAFSLQMARYNGELRAALSAPRRVIAVTHGFVILDGGYGVSPVVANIAANEREQYFAVLEQALLGHSVSVMPVTGVGFAAIGVHSALPRTIGVSSRGESTAPLRAMSCSTGDA
jgi:hypothetical protein